MSGVFPSSALICSEVVYEVTAMQGIGYFVIAANLQWVFCHRLSSTCETSQKQVIFFHVIFGMWFSPVVLLRVYFLKRLLNMKNIDSFGCFYKMPLLGIILFFIRQSISYHRK